MQLQLVGHAARDDQSVTALAGAERRQFTFLQARAQKTEVVVLTNAFEGHTEEVVVGLQNALRIGMRCHMYHIRYMTNSLHQRVVDADRCRDGRLLRSEVSYLNMAAETYHLVADGMLETQDNANGTNHDSQSYSNTNGCYTNGGATHLMSVAFSAIDATGKKERKARHEFLTVNP